MQNAVCYYKKRLDLLLRGQTDIIYLQFNIKAFKFGFPPNKLRTKSTTEVHRKIKTMRVGNGAQINERKLTLL